MQTTLDGKSRDTLSELVKLAIAVGEVREQNRWHSERIQSNSDRITTLERHWTNEAPSPEVPIGFVDKILSGLSNLAYIVRIAWRVYRRVPWGLIIIGATAAWRLFWPLASRWAGL